MITDDHYRDRLRGLILKSIEQAITLIDQAHNTDRPPTALANLKLANAKLSQARRHITIERNILLQEQTDNARAKGH